VFLARRDARAADDVLDFPTVYDGARGVYFVEKTVESARSEKKWLDAHWHSPVH
jgi:hypothetical protein